MPIDEDLINSEEFILFVYKDLVAVAAQNKLNSLEKPKQMKILLDQFTVENDLLTPTMKLKRNIAKQKFAAQIVELYNKPVLNVKKPVARSFEEISAKK
jgi:long-chain acyl-CoA synthetase